MTEERVHELENRSIEGIEGWKTQGEKGWGEKCTEPQRPVT